VAAGCERAADVAGFGVAVGAGVSSAAGLGEADVGRGAGLGGAVVVNSLLAVAALVALAVAVSTTRTRLPAAAPWAVTLTRSLSDLPARTVPTEHVDPLPAGHPVNCAVPCPPGTDAVTLTPAREWPDALTEAVNVAWSWPALVRLTVTQSFPGLGAGVGEELGDGDGDGEDDGDGDGDTDGDGLGDGLGEAVAARAEALVTAALAQAPVAAAGACAAASAIGAPHRPADAPAVSRPATASGRLPRLRRAAVGVEAEGLLVREIAASMSCGRHRNELQAG
jgi:hypothetical protein